MLFEADRPRMTDLPPPLPVAALQLAGLWALAFVQPLFDILGKNAAFFVARDNTAGDILIFAFTFVLVPPLVLTLLVFLARLIARKAGAVVMLTLIALLVAALVMQILKGPLPEAEVLLPVSLALGAGAAALYARAVPARSLFTVLGAAPAVFLALFLLFSPVNELVTPHAEAKSGAGAAASARPPIVVMVFDELPATSLMRPDRRLDAKRFPNFARHGPGGHLVPQRHRRGGRHLRRRAGDLHGPPAAGRAADRAHRTRTTSSGCSGAPTASTPSSP